eukprot:12674032-Alexandrium_andersonii.AAC.1
MPGLSEQPPGTFREPEQFRIHDSDSDGSDADFSSFARACGAPALPYPCPGNPETPNAEQPSAAVANRA